MIEKGPSMYEESLGIPFIVRWPGHIDGGRVPVTHSSAPST